MNEFIVWDKKSKNFIDHRKMTTAVSSTNCLCLFNNGVIFDVKIIASNREEEGTEDCDVTVHKYIHKKDINDKKIYADCSIVEFGNYKFAVMWNNEQLQYDLVCLDNKSIVPMKINEATCKLIKIIDTIQENKLGLIK